MNNIKYALENKIQCNGIKPSKAEVYLLAAELVEIHDIKYFKSAVIAAIASHDYDYECEYDYDYGYYYGYYYDYYDYDYDYCDYCDYCDNDYYHDYSKEQKVIALLFLSAIYSAPKE